MFQKCFVLLTTLVITMSVLAGCGNDNEQLIAPGDNTPNVKIQEEVNQDVSKIERSDKKNSDVARDAPLTQGSKPGNSDAPVSSQSSVETAKSSPQTAEVDMQFKVIEETLTSLDEDFLNITIE